MCFKLSVLYLFFYLILLVSFLTCVKKYQENTGRNEFICAYSLRAQFRMVRKAWQEKNEVAGNFVYVVRKKSGWTREGEKAHVKLTFSFSF